MISTVVIVALRDKDDENYNLFRAKEVERIFKGYEWIGVREDGGFRCKSGKGLLTRNGSCEVFRGTARVTYNSICWMIVPLRNQV